MNPKQLFLRALFAFVLIGLTACGAPQPSPEASDVTVQPHPSTAMPQPSSAVQDNSASSYNCTDGEPHVVGQSVATTYEMSYEQVMTWFCSGFSFENILIALETSEAVDVPADTLLQMLQEKEWEEIWVEVGFTDDQ